MIYYIMEVMMHEDVRVPVALASGPMGAAR
jgi:hypothetical protein